MSIILDNIKTEIFSNISFNLSTNEKVAIVGENGIGKTTLLRTLLGLIPFDGKMKILDNELKERKDFKSVYGDIGYLFQDSDDSFIAPSVLEEVAFNIYNKTGNFDEAVAKSESLLQEFKIEHLKDKVPIKLSGGQKRIVSICAVLAHEPKILFLDEPSNHLDSKVSSMIKERLKNYKGSMIMVAHDLEFAKDVVNKFYKLSCDGLKEINV